MSIQWQTVPLTERSNDWLTSTVQRFNLASPRLAIRVTGASNRLLNWSAKPKGEFGTEAQLKLNGQIQLNYSSEYGTETMTWPYRNYYANRPEDWTKRLDRYHEVMHSEFSSLQDLLTVLTPVFEQLDNGTYLLELRDMVPTDGASPRLWSGEAGVTIDNPATRDVVFEGLDTHATVIDDAFPLYLLPTESHRLIDQGLVTAFGESEDLGFGLAYAFEGYTALLLDGHHRALAAQRQGRLLPCVVIRPYPYYEVSLSNRWQVVGQSSRLPRVTESEWHANRHLDFPNLATMAMLSNYECDSNDTALQALPLVPDLSRTSSRKLDEAVRRCWGCITLAFDRSFLL